MIKFMKNGRRPFLYRSFASSTKKPEDGAADVSPAFEKEEIDEIFSP